MIEAFQVEKHFHLLKKWMEERAMTAMDIELIPQNGFVYSEKAMGFLYITDSSLGFIDNYICDPEIESEEREKAFFLITNMILSLAKNIGLKKIIASTNKNRFRDMSLNSGFKYVGEYSIYMKEV